MSLKKKMLFEASVEYAHTVSSQVAKIKVYILYAGKNRNSTHFSKYMIEQKLIPSLYGMPIIGEFIQDKDDFGTHGGKIVIKDDDITYEQTTVALGFIPESSEIKWEEVEEINGEKREYLTATAYVWYKRFPEVEKILEEPRNQSMEIEIKEAEWREDMKAYDILDAEISGLCILGKDVEPCFESAKIGRFAFGDLKSDFALMAQELKEIIKDSEVKEMEKTIVNPESTEEAVIAEPEVSEGETSEFTENPVEENTEAKPEETEEATEEVEEEVEAEEASEEEPTEESSEEEAEEAKEEVEEESEEEAFESKEETGSVNFEEENSQLKAEIQSLQTELEDLREYRTAKLNEEKAELIESFSGEFGEEEINPIKEKMGDFSKEELETQLFALLGKKKMNYTAVKKTDVNKVIALTEYETQDNLPSWARAIEQHTKTKKY